MDAPKLKVLALGINPYSGGHQEVRTLYCDKGGIKGDKHHGVMANPGVQEVDRLKRMGIEVSRDERHVNGRQISAISQAEMRSIASTLGVDPKHLGISQLRANILLAHSDEELDFTGIPHGAYIRFHGNGRAILEVHWQNNPCTVAGSYIEESCKVEGVANRFPKAAYGKRGLVLKVYRLGKIKKGDVATVHLR